MRSIVCLLLGAVLFSGCAIFKRHSNNPAPAKARATDQKVIITPDNSRTGRVVSVNTSGRFVVLNFPIGMVPPVGTSLSVYRQGLKVGELKLTGLQSDENTVADITQGDAIAGDLVRTQ